MAAKKQKKSKPNQKVDRITEISERLGKLSFKLLEEGTKDGNVEILKLGSIIHLLSITNTNKDEMHDVHTLASMYSAKKVLDNHPEIFLKLGLNGADEK